MNATSNRLALRGKLLRDEAMAKHTSWRLGGPADAYYVPADLADLQQFLAQLDADTDILWLGLGSNLLVRDGGFRGQVIAPLNALKQMQLQLDGNLYVECGSSCARLAKFCQKKGLGGADFFAGIPGTVGGALAIQYPRTLDTTVMREEIAQLLRHVGHRGKVGDAALVNPLHQLTRAKRLFAIGSEKRLERASIEIEQVYSGGCRHRISLEHSGSDKQGARSDITLAPRAEFYA